MRTIISSLPRNILRVVSALGHDPAPLTEAAGIRQDALEDPDGRISLESYARLWSLIVDVPGVRDGLAVVARQTDVSDLGVVGYVMANSRTLHDAFSAYERHGRLIANFVAFRVRADDRELRVEFACPQPFAGMALFNEGSVVQNHALARVLAGREPPLTAVLLSSPAHEGSAAFERTIGAPCVYGAGVTALVYPAEVAGWPVQKADPALFPFLERHAAAVRALVGDGAPTWTQRTRDEVMTTLHDGVPAQRSVARRLAVSERTLQRRLREEGTTYAAIVDECRRELALRHVADPSLPLAEVAFLLGYSETSAFHRAFRRWTGATPSEARRRSGAGGDWRPMQPD